MTAQPTARQRQWGHGVLPPPDKACAACGAAFYTNVGLAEHRRLGCGNGHGSPVRVRRRRRYTDAGRSSLQERGRQVAARNNARRVRCGTCGHVSTPSGVGLHQRFTGHTGRTEL